MPYEFSSVPMSAVMTTMHAMSLQFCLFHGIVVICIVIVITIIIAIIIAIIITIIVVIIVVIIVEPSLGRNGNANVGSSTTIASDFDHDLTWGKFNILPVLFNVNLVNITTS